ncbi:hypothetical protein DF3PA_20027 [Candidatus Defluviicoccus seviourii]|uniref:Uncharacterized protein n=1 Tax=Candidatus Defluviicoccus seviourii TaxID=2565273 RepID=A0A564WC93_9PROT|nr:hypothetical protein DF3PA_20027 [Candidatus Defluviicoccus seviourii]
MRGRRRGRLVQGSTTGRLHRAESWRHPQQRGDRARRGADGARADRRRRRLQAGRRRRPPAEDAVGQDPARHDAEDRRRRAVEDASHDRRSRHPRRDQGGAGGDWLWALAAGLIASSRLADRTRLIDETDGAGSNPRAVSVRGSRMALSAQAEAC